MTSTAIFYYPPRRIALWSGLLVACMGVVVLLGWFFDNNALKSVFPGLVAMKPNTAVGLLLGGTALVLLAKARTSQATRRIVALMAVLLVVLGVLTLGEYVFGWNAGIDKLLFYDDAVSLDSTNQGRMAPSTALAILLLGGTLLVACFRPSRRLRLPMLAALSATILVIGSMALLGYVAKAILHSTWWNYAGMAVHTAAGLVVLGAGILALTRSQGGLRWSLDKLTTIGFAFGILALLGPAAVAFHFTNELQESAEWVSLTHLTLKEIRDVMAGMADLESSQRGYLILGDERLLEHREQVKEAVRESLADIRKLTSGNSIQQRRLEQLEPLIDQRVRFGEQNILVRRQKGFPEAQAMLATGTGIRLSEAINRSLIEMNDQENSLLVQRQLNSSSASTRAFLMLPLGVFLSLAVLYSGLFFMNASAGESKRAELAFQESEQLFAKAFRLSPDYMSIVRTADHTVVRINEALCRIWGTTLDEAIGQPTQNYCNWLNEEEELAFLHALHQTGEYLNCQTLMRMRDGRLVWFLISSRLVMFNEQSCMLSVMRDISETRRKEASLREQVALLDLAPIAIISRDMENRITFWSRGAEALYGISREDAMGKVTHSYLHTKFSASLAEIEREIHGLGTWEGELIHSTNTGKRITVASRWALLRDGQGLPVGYLEINSDISERKLAEEQVQQLNASLEQRVNERTIQLEAVNKELEAFSYSVSHDLRAPLRAVDGFSQAVLEDYGPQMPEDGRRMLHTLRQSAQRMGALIDDLLRFSQLGRKPLQTEVVDTSRLVRGVIEDLSADHEHRHVAINVGDLPECQSDPALLHQVWVNLVSNALKYTSKREQAVVEIGCVRKNGSNVYFIRDNGTGFDMRYADKLFGVFQRLHRIEEYEGTGVGLAIVHQVVKRHGGRVWAEAAVDRGATFYFTLGNGAK
jgi:PAS domain S-box-containing protein